MIFRLSKDRALLFRAYGHHLQKFVTHSNASVKTRWKIVFFGTDNFALDSLQQLHAAMLNRQIVDALSVVIPPPKPHLCAVGDFAQSNQLPMKIWPLSKEASWQENWDIGVVASFGHLIPLRIIKCFPLGMLNVHASLLPKWRGAAPIIHAVANGDTETGVSIMRIEPFHFDVGAVLARERLPIDPEVTAIELTRQLASLGARCLIRTLGELPSCLDRSIPQSEQGATAAPKVDVRWSHIDWSILTAQEIYNRWRAVQHLFKLTTTMDGDRIRLDGALPPLEHLPPHLARFSNPPDQNGGTAVVPGYLVVDRKRNVLLVRCYCGHWIAFRNVAPNGKKATMTALDFANGYLHQKPRQRHFFGT